MGLLKPRNLVLLALLAVTLLPTIKAAGEFVSNKNLEHFLCSFHSAANKSSELLEWMMSGVKIMQFFMYVCVELLSSEFWWWVFIYVIAFLCATNMRVISINQSLSAYGPLNLKATAWGERSRKVFWFFFISSLRFFLFSCVWRITTEMKNVIYNLSCDKRRLNCYFY